MMVKIKIFIILFCSLYYAANAQIAGCTDPSATNYNSAATINNGSCLYPYTSANVQSICALPTLLNETSGLLFYQNKLYTVLDGGNKNEIYEIDTATGQVVKTIVLKNTSNIDWEEITASNNRLFIGDFGNNNGSRTDLKIYYFDWNMLTNGTSTDSILPQLISFQYADQNNFTPLFNNNSWDAEAMIYWHDSLYIFTKDWVNNKTKLYAMPATAGSYSLLPIDSFYVAGLITAATADTSKNQIELVGYTSGGFSFMWQLYGFTDNHFFKANKRKIELGFAGQTEGICKVDNTKWFLSNEQLSIFPARLSTLNKNNFSVNTGFKSGKKKIMPTYSIYPNPADDEIFISQTTEEKQSTQTSKVEIQICDIFGKCIGRFYTRSINTKTFGNGLYSILYNNLYIGKILIQH